MANSAVSNVIPHIISQHAEEAAFLWLLRDAAVHAPHYDLKDLAKLDGRIEAHLDGLRIAGEAGWLACEENLSFEEPGEVFAAAVMALEGNRMEWLQRVSALIEKVPETKRAFVSALDWVEGRFLQGKVKGLLDSNSAFWLCIGIAACVHHRVNPGAVLLSSLQSDDPVLRACCFRAVGQLGLKDQRPQLKAALADAYPFGRFWAAWSLLLLGERGGALGVIKQVASESPSALQLEALNLLLRVLDCAEAQAWLKALMSQPDRLRTVIIGVGFSGDPLYVPWLIKQMAAAEFARVAGEAFSNITGVDIAYDDLDGEWPAGFEAGPTENPEDENVEMDADEDLPWPEPSLIQACWQEQQGQYRAGERYLVGKPISEAHCQEVLRTGQQRQRLAAALELALMQPESVLFEVGASGARQQRLLAL
ncbi:MAG: TIGR02270 family protein [Gammaproteobacteria bacterium]|nr:TIGR02270 family protein [Gammaproteobacteria bacterium]